MSNEVVNVWFLINAFCKYDFKIIVCLFYFISCWIELVFKNDDNSTKQKDLVHSLIAVIETNITKPKETYIQLHSLLFKSLH